MLPKNILLTATILSIKVSYTIKVLKESTFNLSISLTTSEVRVANQKGA